MSPTTPGCPVRVAYTETPRQAVFHGATADEVLYGGAAGGGKSAAVRHEALAFALQVPGSRQAIFRRTFPDLSRDMIPKMRLEVPAALGTYNGVEHAFTLFNGSVIELAYLSRDADVTRFQGAEYQRIYVDEATQFTEFQVRYLLSRIRAGGPVVAALAAAGLRPGLRLTANPGGIGHEWVKRRFIDPAPPGVLFRQAPTVDDPHPGTRLFVPAGVADNPHIDEGYADRLDRLDPDTRRALKFGDWDVYTGQAFREWRRDVHVVEPDEVPLSIGGVVRAVGVDYGMSAPFAALWGAKLGDGLVYVYREVYAAELTPDQQADAILAAEAPGERAPGRPVPVALDPATWARAPHEAHPRPLGGRTIDPTDPDVPPPGSIAAAYRARFGPALVKARNDRMAGVALVRDKLRVREDGAPRLLVSSTCRNLIRTLPALPRDLRRPEDVDTTAEDHAFDALRYLLMELEGTPVSARSRRAGSRNVGRVPTVTSELGGVQF